VGREALGDASPVARGRWRILSQRLCSMPPRQLKARAQRTRIAGRLSGRCEGNGSAACAVAPFEARCRRMRQTMLIRYVEREKRANETAAAKKNRRREQPEVVGWGQTQRAAVVVVTPSAGRYECTGICGTSQNQESKPGRMGHTAAMSSSGKRHALLPARPSSATRSQPMPACERQQCQRK